jgi:tetratricopeptide (TPR) repeat protein
MKELSVIAGNERRKKMKSLIFVLKTLFPLILVLAFRVPCGLAIEDAVDDAVLSGNWKEVYNILEKDSRKANDPVARLLMAHACLVTNRNNASLLLFVSAKEEKDIKLWSEWADSLQRRHPQNPVALYLSADAKARAGKLQEAKEGFTQALQIKDDFALALNARGVVQALTNDLNSAQVDFYSATKLAPDFADAYVNLGTLGVLRETSLDLDTGTLEVFNQAIAINPDFALAYNGRGCIYFGSGRFEEAARDFNTGSQLSPVLVIAELNQGFASAYASKLITLASMEKKPGTTFESLHQKYPDMLKEQQQQLFKTLPTQNEQEFWKKIDVLPWLPPEQRQALVNEYGLQKVQMAGFLKMQDLKSQIAQTHQKNLVLADKVDSYNRGIIGSAFVDFTSSAAFSSLGLIKTMQEGWKPLLKEGAWDVGKTGVGSLLPKYEAKVLFSGLLADPFSSTMSSVSKLSDRIFTDKLSVALSEGYNNSLQSAVQCNKLRAYEEILPSLGTMDITTSIRQPPTHIPGYYTYVDRPLTELSALASMVDKGIKPVGDLPRSALIVSQDPFRTNLLQSELSKYGIETKVILLGIDPQAEANRWGANVILGIKGIPEMKMPQISRIPPGIETPQVTLPEIKQNWNWGKSYIPTYPKGAPGGISTEELAKSFVDKGNWPVMTSFGLFYQAGPSAESEKEGREK